MIAMWYSFVSLLLILYVILDGRNFGVGMLHWFVAKTAEERRQVVAAIGPMWTWHEVWLISFGGTALAIFPRLMAASFAGYYLALFLILWCFILRGMALELGGHIDDRMWQGFWDFVLFISSTLLAVLFGAAGGNVARGVPLDADGNFSMAFFTNFGVQGNNLGLLDWYTVSVAVFATVMLAAHGATYLTLKTNGPVHDRSEALARWLWAAIAPLLAMVSLESWYVRPDLPGRMVANPLVWVGVAGILVSAGALVSGLRGRHEMRAFLGGNFLIVGMLGTGAAGIFPVMLFSTLAPENSMTAYSVATSPHALFVASLWWPVAFILTVGYFVAMSRYYYGKVSAPATGIERVRATVATLAGVDARTREDRWARPTFAEVSYLLVLYFPLDPLAGGRFNARLNLTQDFIVLCPRLSLSKYLSVQALAARLSRLCARRAASPAYFTARPRARR